jgi:hypothetical protein
MKGAQGVGGFPVESSRRATILPESAVLRHFLFAGREYSTCIRRGTGVTPQAGQAYDMKKHDTEFMKLCLGCGD